MNAKKLMWAVRLCMENYTNHRLWDKNTPYFVHPVWCAMMFLQETKLPAYGAIFREECALALLFHDWLEDVEQPLPNLNDAIKGLIKEMTFSGEKGSTEIEIRGIWSKEPLIRLLKLYDKVSNLLDGAWMPDEKWNEQYVPYVLRLANDVEANYGDLNIVRMARAVAVPRLSPTNRA